MSPPSPSSSAAIEFDRVSFTYPGALTPALAEISLRVEVGERLGILGPNGGGKSTLIKLALGLLKPSSGTLRVCGLSAADARQRGLIGYVPQRTDAELALPVSAREVVTLGAAWRTPSFSRTPAAIRDRVEHMLHLVGAETFAHRPVRTLSGGQLQRVLIARALAAEVRILALDEPTVGIDAVGQQKFAELLDRVHREYNADAANTPSSATASRVRQQPAIPGLPDGLTILIISHDIRAIAAGSDRVACLAGRLHSHTSPRGLTPQVLAELFAHDLAGLPGALHGMHLHAHGPMDPCADPAGAVTERVSLTIGGTASPTSNPAQSSPHASVPTTRRTSSLDSAVGEREGDHRNNATRGDSA